MIGGNTTAIIQVKSVVKNSNGEGVETWTTSATLKGWLDLSGGDAKYQTFNTKLQESTHVFVCDYVNIDTSATNKRMVIDGKNYDILMIDNPMGLNLHIEITLKYVGE